MRRSVFANLDVLDPETRDAAEAAARKAGLRLEDWVGEILADRLARRSVPPPPKRRVTADDLDVLIGRMAKSGRKSHAYDDDLSLQNASAVESVARWIESTEERLAETARHSSTQQDRMASAMSDALSALKDRLDAVERHVVAERPPARIEFPVEEAVKALSPLADTLVGLRADVSRLAERLDQPVAGTSSAQAVDAIASQIDDLHGVLSTLATREEIDALDGNLRGLLLDLEKKPSGKSILTLVGAIDTLHGQVADLSDDLKQEFHLRLASEIESLERKIDRLAQSGIDRSVVDFLSSQIVDLRHDLASRAEPEQIERLSADMGRLTHQISELRSQQVGKADFVALRTALEKVCGALASSVAQQQANDIPEQIRGLGEKLDALARRPEPEPAGLDPIAAQLTHLTDKMAAATAQRFDRDEVVLAQFERLSEQVGRALESSSAEHVPLRERFDRLEAGLREVGDRTDMSNVETMLRGLEEKLRPAVSLRDEAESIAERAARAAIRDVRPENTESTALRSGFAELKSLQARADSKTQQTLLAVQGALEMLVARFADHEPSNLAHPGGRLGTEPADRLEAAVRRLHAATLSQIEEVSASAGAPSAASSQEMGHSEQRAGASIPGQEHDLGNVRASFIAAARRASQTSLPAATEDDGRPAASVAPESTEPSLIERLRRTFEGKRRPLLFGIALLIVAVAAAETAGPGKEVPVAALEATAAPLGASLLQPSSFGSPEFASTATNVAAPRDIAATGNPSDLYELASRLGETDAARLFEKAARAGFVPAQQRIAAIYEQGLGVPRDPSLAMTWYERAAQAGNVKAMHHLATLLAAGVQGAPDYAAAFRWYAEAADGGLRDSQFNLGVLYTRGVGTPRSLPRAYQWFDVAARQGDADAAAKRDEIAKRMAPPELAAAKLLAERWRARPIDPAANDIPAKGPERTASYDPHPGGKS